MLMDKTTYFILLGILISAGLTSVWYIQSTPNGDPVIVAVGDIACSNDSEHRGNPDWCHELQTSNLALSVNPDAVLLLGDLQYYDGKYEDFLGSYDPTWGRMKSISYPAPGNHEYQSFDGAKGYFDYFGPKVGDPTKGYYSFDIGYWHIVSLNSNCQEKDPEDPTKYRIVSCSKLPEQIQWLKNDLASDDSKCTLAFWAIQDSPLEVEEVMHLLVPFGTSCTQSKQMLFLLDMTIIMRDSYLRPQMPLRSQME